MFDYSPSSGHRYADGCALDARYFFVDTGIGRAACYAIKAAFLSTSDSVGSAGIQDSEIFSYFRKGFAGTGGLNTVKYVSRGYRGWF
jgi:hypothetical protein